MRRSYWHRGRLRYLRSFCCAGSSMRRGASGASGPVTTEPSICNIGGDAAAGAFCACVLTQCSPAAPLVHAGGRPSSKTNIALRPCYREVPDEAPRHCARARKCNRLHHDVTRLARHVGQGLQHDQHAHRGQTARPLNLSMMLTECATPVTAFRKFLVTPATALLLAAWGRLLFATVLPTRPQGVDEMNVPSPMSGKDPFLSL